MTSKAKSGSGVDEYAPLHEMFIGGLYNLGRVMFTDADIVSCKAAFESCNPIHDRGVVFGALELGRVTEMVRDWAIATDLSCRDKVSVTMAQIELLGLLKAGYIGQLEVLVTGLVETVDPDVVAETLMDADELLKHIVQTEVEFDFQIRRVSRASGEPQVDLFCWGTLRGIGKT